jgi:hypothetical protein
MATNALTINGKSQVVDADAATPRYVFEGTPPVWIPVTSRVMPRIVFDDPVCLFYQ